MLRVEKLKLPNEKVISFSLKDNEGVVIEGPNGAGKSLLLKSLALLYPVSCEEFFFQDKNVRGLNPQEFRSQVLYVSTNVLLVKDQSVEEFFQSVLKLAVYKNHEFKFDYHSYLKKWGITNQSVSILSSGQRQMIAVLRALSLKAKILLLDEPTANLDQDKTLEVEELLKEWRVRTGGGIIMISHSPEQATRLGFKKVQFSELEE